MRTLKVKCPTWKHVETFYKRKLRRDKTLTIRVPFNPEVGSELAIRLQMPNGNDLEIPGEVKDVLPDGGGLKAAITLHLVGFTDEVIEHLNRVVEENRVTTSGPVNEAPSQASVSVPSDPEPQGLEFSLPPTSKPSDAPLDERVAEPYVPRAEDISEFEREVFDQLQGELANLRELAANEIFDIPIDADVGRIRSAYFQRTKRFHPDVFAKYRSPAIMHMAQEVFIHINRAYDLMRDAAVREGRAVAAGPALLPHDGWLAGFDDITSVRAPQDDARTGPHMRAGNAPRDIPAQAAQLMAAGELERARALVAATLHGDPRNRSLRALYYVIGGEQALAKGDDVLAASQFESALAHDPESQPARIALDQLRARRAHGGVHPKSLR